MKKYFKFKIFKRFFEIKIKFVKNLENFERFKEFIKIKFDKDLKDFEKFDKIQKIRENKIR